MKAVWILAFAAATISARAQEKPFVVQSEKPAAQASAADAEANCPKPATIPELLNAVDENVSGPGTKDFTCLRTVFLPGGRIIVVQKLDKPNAAGIDIGLRPMTIEQYIEIAKKRSGAAYEKQTGYKVDRFGNMASVWTTYQISSVKDGPPIARGVNSFQAVFDGKQWHVVEVLYQTENKDNPLPSLAPVK